MLKLAVCIDYVAVLRNTIKEKEPDPIVAAVLAEAAGADGIVCYFKEDKKYLKERDLLMLKEVVKSHLNIGIAPTEEMVKIALKVSPDMVTFVPEIKEGRSSKVGVNVELKFDRIAGFTDRLHSNGIIVSYFIDPEVGKKEPQCIAVCPKEAIALKNVVQIGEETRIEAAKRLFAEVIEDFES